jgi:transcription-repair coupling factor (superfamily II helicase)
VTDPEKVRTRAHDLVRTSQEFLEASWATAAVGGQAPIDLGAAAYRTLVDVREHAGSLGLPWWTVSPFTADEDLEDDAVVLAAQPPPAYRGEVERAIADLRAGRPTGGASSSRPRDTGRASACTSCSRTPRCPPAWTTRPASPGSSSSPPAASRPASAASC